MTVKPSPTAQLTITQAGSVGADFSGNAPTGPGEATSFSFNSGTVFLLATVPANQYRDVVEVNNTTGSPVVIVMDDGLNTAGTVSLFPLAPGAGANQQGGDWVSQIERGRIRVYGASGTFCFVREN